MTKNAQSEISNLQSLRVLMVEDSEDDALLVLRELKKGGYNPEYERVETAAAMRKALQDKTWDLILCDYQLPGFSGIEAIAVLKEINIDIPIIMVSGAIGEETAVEWMRLGAYDYIMKNNFSRLVPAIERELKEAESRAQRKQAEEALRESETKLQAIFDTVGTGILIIDKGTQAIIEANQTAIEMTGLPKERIIGQICHSLVCPAQVGKCPVKDLGQSVDHSERKLIHADGHLKDILKTVYPIILKGRDCYVESFIDITDRKLAEKQLRESLEQLRRAVQTTIQVLVMAVEMKDPYTAGHQRRMTNLARTMATEMGLPPEKIEGLRMAGVIHDIGKITLPTEILSKPTKLSAIELSLIREHVRLGYDILKDVECPWPLAEIVLQHHERMDGSGYPRGLKGEEILIEARILAVADVVEAMASHRPYRPALGLDAALEEIEKNRGILYDNTIVDACLRLFRGKGFKLEGTDCNW
jgi:PAS domain S-box-containing protein